jgi:K+-sensing histidine kinase KdpD
MVRDDEERLFYLALGPVLAILVGGALMPLRDVVAVPTLAFPFIIVTIVAAEFGGHPAAFATAFASALSQDFFLTRPYMTLEIGDKHDVTAFLGFAACGVVAAALGARRQQRTSSRVG